MTETVIPPLRPYDEHNQRLESNVHPRDWVNPKPDGRYNLVVIGGGTAGLVTAAGAAGLGAKVALVERDLLGGDCLNVGCVPSKSIIRSARSAAAIRDAHRFGAGNDEPSRFDFGKVMTRMRELRAHISPHDSAARFRDLGVDVFLGHAEFVSSDSIRVGERMLSFRKAVVCTGARATELPIPGLADVGCLTNESVFSLTSLPNRLVVLGGGPIGCEMAQSFARLGSEVTLVEKNRSILSREEADAAQIVQNAMANDGVQFVLNANVAEVRRLADGKGVVVEVDGERRTIEADEILAGVGRAPNVEGMGLERVGVSFDTRTGIEVNDRLQTTNRRIYAAGDVASRYKFTHAADFMARIAIQNSLFMGRAKVSDLVIPWATYTSPELAHVGLYPRDAESNGISIDTFTQEFSSVDRAILDGESEGFVRVHVRKGTDRIVGATVVASHAGDLIGELTLAIKNKIGLKAIGSTIHPYPTHSEAIRRLGDMYSRTRLTPAIQRMFGLWLRWTR